MKHPQADPLAGLDCPTCHTQFLHSPTPGYESCWCRRCGSHIALSASVEPTAPHNLRLTVAGIRRGPVSLLAG